MKKFLYVVLLLVVLLAIAYVLKSRQAPVVSENNPVAENKPVAEDVVAVVNDSYEEDIVVVDEEPTSDVDETEGEIVAEDVVEENPEETADEGETIVD